jgi:hypothetical protein
MKGKSLGVVNDNYRDNFERTFSKKCPGCREILSYFKIKPGELSSCECMDCGKTMINEHKTPEEGS